MITNGNEKNTFGTQDCAMPVREAIPWHNQY
jgi:hypothetical protein